MNSSSSWHVDTVSAQRYAERATDPTTSASVESHIAACSTCATAVSAATERLHGDLLMDVWSEIDRELDAPRLGIFERAVRAVGCPEATSRVVAATARAQWSCLSAVALSVGLAVFASQSGNDGAFLLFLLFAPIGPLAATAAAFERFAEPVEDLLRTVPTSLWRIALIRSISAVVPSILLTALSVPILSERGWLALAWMLPSMALSVAAFALSKWLGVQRATVVVTFAWLVIPVVVRLRGDVLIDAMAHEAQFVSVAVLLVGAVTVATQRTTFDYRGFS
ncbi:MAG TPA: hypothetical protein VMM60_10145 [Ilumatobacter sp.]|nr:hypothetical protein [Ilumatobacter sp.]